MLPAVVAGLLGLLVLAAAPSADRTTTRYSEAVTSAASALPRPTRLRKALDAPVAARTPREPAAARPNPPPPTQTAVGSDGPAAPHRPHAAPEALRDPRALRALGPSLTIVVLLVLFFKPRGRPFRAGPPPPDARLWAPLRAHEGNPLPRPLALRRPLEKKRKPPFVEPTATMSPDLRLLEDEVQVVYPVGRIFLRDLHRRGGIKRAHRALCPRCARAVPVLCKNSVVFHHR